MNDMNETYRAAAERLARAEAEHVKRIQQMRDEFSRELRFLNVLYAVAILAGVALLLWRPR